LVRSCERIAMRDEPLPMSQMAAGTSRTYYKFGSKLSPLDAFPHRCPAAIDPCGSASPARSAAVPMCCDLCVFVAGRKAPHSEPVPVRSCPSGSPA
jgi:hypothetical protein